MINKIWNWVKNIFKPEKQDPHLTLYEPKPCKGHRRFRNNCEDCREASS